MRRRVTLAVVALGLFIAIILIGKLNTARSASLNVLTNRGNIARNNANLEESILTTANVNPAQFGKLFERSVTGDIYAQPLYVSGLDIPGKGTHNVVFAATEHNRVYAFDADDPQAASPLWQDDFGDPFTANLSTDDVWGGEDGVLSTPVIDLASETLYVVAHHNGTASSTPPNKPYHDLHALDLMTGAEKFGGPVAIQVSVPGNGWGSSKGTITFDSNKQLQRAGLLLLNGVVYVAFGSTHDDYPAHGWIVAYSADLKTQTAVLNMTPGIGLGGIWQAGSGIASDGTNLFVSTGNGSYNGLTDFGDSVVKLSPSLSVLDWFTPSDECYLNEYDKDMGSTGPVLIPQADEVLAGNKLGLLYVLKQSNLGKFVPNQSCQVPSDPEDNPQIPQWAEVGSGEIFNTPIYWNSRQLGPVIYTWSTSDSAKSYKLVDGLIPLPVTPLSTSAAQAPATPSDTLILSANGDQPGSAILWGAQDSSQCAHCGILRAWDATDLTKELWNSDANASRDSYGNIAKFDSPTIVNGKVYVGTFSNRLDVYGLLP